MNKQDSNFSRCMNELIALSTIKGYLTYEDISNVSIDYGIGITDLDEMTEELVVSGIIFREENDDQNIVSLEKETSDYSQINYDETYREIIQHDPSLKTIVEYTRSIRPAQFGEIQQLLPQLINNNEYVKNRMFEVHMRVVLRIALLETKKYQYELSDAVSEGMIGLAIGISKFQPESFRSFQGYVSTWIIQTIHRFCKSKWMIVYYPAHAIEEINRIINVCNDSGFDCLNGIIPNDDEIKVIFKNNLEINADRAMKSIRDFENQYYRLSASNLLSDAPEFSFNEFEYLAKQNDSTSVSHFHNVESVDYYLNTISSREKQIILMRFGIGYNHAFTLEEIGVREGITRERVRQIESKAIRKMRLVFEKDQNKQKNLESKY